MKNTQICTELSEVIKQAINSKAVKFKLDKTPWKEKCFIDFMFLVDDFTKNSF